ncbi:hypothetical protein ACFPM0_18150 [Pseudonocardia sulfidoxydans]
MTRRPTAAPGDGGRASRRTAARLTTSHPCDHPRARYFRHAE